jgi:hypothetical protein
MKTHTLPDPLCFPSCTVSAVAIDPVLAITVS